MVELHAILLAAGGCVNIFRPRSVGEGTGRAWYPVWNAGSTYAMAAEAGAEMTMMENRFVPTRFKDGYGPVGAWFLLFKSQATNAIGETYMTRNKDMLDDYPPYGQAAVPASCLRNHLMLKEMKEGRGPIWMDTVTALANLRETLTPREVKHLEAEAWEDFLDMCIGQCGIWAGENIEPEKKNSELMPTEPYLLGSHSGCCGIWASGPTDVGAPTSEEHPEKDKIPSHLPEGWNWGYRGMTTVKGLFTAGDGVGASGHKFSSGSHAEGRMCAKSMVKFVMDNKDHQPELDTDVDTLIEEIYRPVRNFLEHKDYTTAIDVNPNYITPKMLQLRLQKVMDEYVAGVSTLYQTNAHLMAAIPNRLLLESNMTANPLKEGLFNEELKAVNGYIDVPERPGLGVDPVGDVRPMLTVADAGGDQHPVEVGDRRQRTIIERQHRHPVPVRVEHLGDAFADRHGMPVDGRIGDQDTCHRAPLSCRVSSWLFDQFRGVAVGVAAKKCTPPRATEGERDAGILQARGQVRLILGNDAHLAALFKQFGFFERGRIGCV